MADERRPQVVAEHAGEHLVQPQRLLLLLQRGHELLFLAVQLEEHFRLAAQDVRLERLVEEVDRAGVVALEQCGADRARRR